MLERKQRQEQNRELFLTFFASAAFAAIAYMGKKAIQSSAVSPRFLDEELHRATFAILQPRFAEAQELLQRVSPGVRLAFWHILIGALGVTELSTEQLLNRENSGQVHSFRNGYRQFSQQWAEDIAQDSLPLLEQGISGITQEQIIKQLDAYIQSHFSDANFFQPILTEARLRAKIQRDIKMVHTDAVATRLAYVQKALESKLSSNSDLIQLLQIYRELL